MSDTKNTVEKTAVDYYNLGTQDFAENKLESAWIHFGMAKARSQDPAVDRALEAVEAALSSSGKRAADLDPASDSFLQLGERLPLTPLTLGSGVILLIAVIVVIISWLKRSTRPIYWWFAGLSFFATLSLLILSFWSTSFPPAWVVSEEVARTGPGTSFLEVQRVKVGTKLRFVRRDKEWIRVRLNRNGAEGYLPAGSLLLWGDE